MALVLSACRLLLVIVFIASGIAKLCDPAGTRRTLSDFRVPERLVSVGAVTLPLTELLIGVLLLPTRTVAAASIAASILLATFCAFVAMSLAQGRIADCHCFGNLHSSPISRQLLARDGGLLAAAVLVTVGSFAGTSVSFARTWTDLATSTQVVIVVGILMATVLTFQTWFSLNLLRQNGHIIARLERLENVRGQHASAHAAARAAAPLRPGMTAPGFTLLGTDGRHHTLDSVRGAGRLLLVFTSESCGPCTALLPDIAHWQREYADELQIVVIATGDAERNRERLTHTGVTTMLLAPDDNVHAAYGAYGTPTAVAIDADGLIIDVPASGRSQILALLTRLLPNGTAVTVGASSRPLVQLVATATNGHHRPEVPA